MNNKTQYGLLIILVVITFALLASVFWPALKMSNQQANTEVQQVVQDFYHGYLAYEGNPLVDHAYRPNQYLSPAMIAFLDDFTQDDIHYDPVLCAQDKPVEIKVAPPTISGGQASVMVNTSFEGHAFTVELVNVDGNWLIDNVTCRP